MRSRRLISAPEFRGQSSETMGPRTDAAADFDDDKGVMGEAIPVVLHAGLFVLSPQDQALPARGPPAGFFLCIRFRSS